MTDNKTVETTTLNPADYFAEVKSRKQTMTDEKMNQVYDNCLSLLNEYNRSGQIAAQKKLMFHLDIIERERQLLKLGVDTFVYKSDVDDYIHMVKDRVVKIQELENYQRRIPEEIIQRIEACKGIFDKMYVVFTDYTKREERRVEAIRREHDPILFGTFQDQQTLTVVERFYFIGDWVDEYCDLTLDKMVATMKAEAKKDIRNVIQTPKDIETLRTYLDRVTPDMNGLYRKKEEKAKGSTFITRIKKAVKAFKAG